MEPREKKGGWKHGRDGEDGVINDGLIKKGDILPLKSQTEQEHRIMVLKFREGNERNHSVISQDVDRGTSLRYLSHYYVYLMQLQTSILISLLH